MKVVIYKGKGLQPWRFRAVAANGETVATSEGYLTRWNARRAARKVFPDAEMDESAPLR